jgi:hypothetical protein
MIRKLFKLSMFLLAFLVMQCGLLPYLLPIKALSTWMIITILSLLLFAWVLILDKMSKELFRSMQDDFEL